MRNFREVIETHPLLWFLGSIIAAFLSGAGAYQGALSWSGMKVVRDEATAKFALRIETRPSDASIALVGETGKFFQGITLIDGANEFTISRADYKPQTIRLAKNGANLILSVPLDRIPSIARTGKAVYTGEPLSMQADSMDIRVFLEVLAEFAQKDKIPINFIFGPRVEGEVTIRLKGVPWDQALEIIVARAGLEMKRSGNVFLIDYAP